MVLGSLKIELKKLELSYFINLRKTNQHNHLLAY